MMETAEELSKSAGVANACQVLGVARSSLYWARQPKQSPTPRPAPERALSSEEKAEVYQTLDSERFWDCTPREVYATLLDEGTYLCHWRTMYRILEEHDEVQERRNQLRHPGYSKPELLATASNQVWSWDITKLRGPFTWVYYYLYVIFDIFSRYVVGWMITECESGELAKELIAATCAKEEIDFDKLTLHSDRGSAMQSKKVAQLMVDLGVTKSLSRPYTANDNPYSEAQFKTMKYRPGYPDRFASLENARAWARDFMHWYNHEHHHTGLGLMTPAMVHHGLADAVYAHRQQVLQAAYEAHPERFVSGMPTPVALAEEVWINRPQSDTNAAPAPDPTLDAAEHLATVGKQAEQPSWTELFAINSPSELSNNA